MVWLVVSAVVLVVIAGGWFTYRQYVLTRDALNAQPAGLDAWDIGQLQRELLAFRAALAEAAVTGAPGNPDELRLHWDLVWSRLLIVTQGETHRAVGPLYGDNNRIPEIERLVRQVDARMPQILLAPRRAAPAVEPLLQQAIAHSQEMYAFGYNAMLTRLEDTKASLQAIQLQASALGVVLLLLVALLIGIVHRTHRARLREVLALLTRLSASEAKLRDLMESSIQGVLVHRGGRAIFANRAFAEMNGFDSVEEVYRLASVFERVEPSERMIAEQAVMLGLDSDTAFTQSELRCIKRDGTPFWVHGVFCPIVWDGEPAILCALIDVTERKQLAEQLRRSQRLEALGALAGGIAHDFNNLIQIMTGYARLALDELGADKRAREDLQKVLDAAERATRLVSQLLAFSGRQPLNPRPVDVNRLIDELVQMLRRVIGTHIEIVTDLSPAAGHVLGDRSLLEQVLMNLCVNARDAMPGGGRLTLRTEPALLAAEAFAAPEAAPAGACVCIAVADTGGGIPPEIQDRIFDPFFTTKEPGKGSGLGLATVHGIVEQHRGIVTVQSALGDGTVFSMYLPVAGAPEAEPEAISETAPTPGRATVLVAEDEPHVQQLAVRFLERAGYRVLTASDGEEAVTQFDAHANTIDLVLLDVVMPRRNGRAVYEHIAAGKRNVPVLFASGYSAEVLGEDFLARENVRLVRKPFQREVLLREVQAALDPSASGQRPD
jgi:PAS domain S-box-containing protein